MPEDKSEKGSRASDFLAIAALVLLICGVTIAVISSRCTGDSKKKRTCKVEDFPRVVFDTGEIDAYTAVEKTKAAGFRPTEEEAALLEALEKLQVDEGGGYPVSVDKDVRMREKQLQDGLVRLRRKSGLDRVLELGDYAAQSCISAFQRGNDSELINRKCGSLMYHAVKSGLIRADGALMGPKHILRVLFKVRWRNFLENVPPLAGLKSLELLAYHDFIVAFYPPDRAQTRLESISQIKKLDSGYPADSARECVKWAAQAQRE